MIKSNKKYDYRNGDHLNILKFTSPAESWEEGLPIGNGFQGAMIFGNPRELEIQCNEDSLWAGNFRDRNNPDTLRKMPEIKRLLLAEKTKEAEELIQEAMGGVCEFQRHYETAGTIYVNNLDHRGEVINYERSLNLENAVVEEQYQIGEVHYFSEAFASYPARLIGYHLQTQSGNGQKVRIRLNRLRGYYGDNILELADDNIVYAGIQGQTADNGVKFAQLCKIETDGKIDIVGQFAIIKNFSDIRLLTSIETSFRQGEPLLACRKVLAMNFDWGHLIAEHIADYHKLYSTVSFSLGNKTKQLDVPTLWKHAKKGTPDTQLIELMFQYGRYLLIAASRPGSLPANLQGIWNRELTPPWDAKYTININTEMNYWEAEKAGLSECHLPLFDLIERMYPNGCVTAKKMYGLDGFAAHHNTDIWGDTAPQDDWTPGTYWPFGAVWLSTHIWEHYQYTRNKEFLANHFFLIEEALRFILGFLAPLANGDLVAFPSLSPENSFHTVDNKQGFLTYGSTMDTQLVWELIQDYLQAVKIVKHDPDLEKKARLSLLHLPKMQVGKYGQLMEWYHDYEEWELGHRHISHLYGLFPGHMLKNESKEIMAAAKVTLERRLANGGGHTGWSAAWLINLWANFGEGNKAGEVVNKLLRDSILPNLLDNHPPFQIDGNYGFTSGIIEMLVQYYDGELKLLPALPDNWTEGNICGVHLPFNSTLDIAWEEGQVTNFFIKGDLPRNTLVTFPNGDRSTSIKLQDLHDRFTKE